MNNYTIQAYVIRQGMTYAGHKVFHISATCENHAKTIVRSYARKNHSVAVIKKIDVEI